jgi:hypothetical protein
MQSIDLRPYLIVLVYIKFFCFDAFTYMRGLFNVRSFYNSLVHNDGTPYPWKNIWQIKVPFREAFFALSAAPRKILTMDHLRKPHVLGLLCKKNKEFMDHLLLHREVSCALWNVLSLSWVMLRLVDLFAC